MQFPIVFGLRRSCILVSGMLIFSLMTLAVVILYFPVAALFKLFLVGLTGLLVFFSWKKLTPGVLEVRLERGGRIAIRCDGQQEFSLASIQPGATVHPWLSVFRVKSDSGQIYTVIATVDNVKRQDFRRLRVFLRWRAEFFNGVVSDVV